MEDCKRVYQFGLNRCLGSDNDTDVGFGLRSKLDGLVGSSVMVVVVVGLGLDMYLYILYSTMSRRIAYRMRWG